MASFRQKRKGWEAAIFIKGHPRKSKTFRNKRDATFWAAEIETEILSGKHGDIPNKKFGDLLRRYSAEVSSKNAVMDGRLTASSSFVLYLPALYYEIGICLVTQ